MSSEETENLAGERFLLRFAPSTENGLPLIWARPRFCEDTFSRPNREEAENLAGERILLRFAPSTENGLPLIWARPRFCEDTFFRLNREESKKVAGEHVDNAMLYEFVKGLNRAAI